MESTKKWSWDGKITENFKTIILFFIIIANFHVIHANPIQNNTEVACPAYPTFKPLSGPLGKLNCEFHAAYEEKIEVMKKTFGTNGGRPIILNLGGKLLLKYNGITESIKLSDDAYHNVKSIAHSAFALYLILFNQQPGKLDIKTENTLRDLQNTLFQTVNSLSLLHLPLKQKELIQQLLEFSQFFVAHVLEKKEWSGSELNQYYKKVNPLFLELITFITNQELSKLDKSLTNWLSFMTEEEIKKIGIVVATVHQARAREITIQYFMKRFGKKIGEGALFEDGLVVLEGSFDEAAALSLLARHYLDREASQIIFNDPEHLQRDVLSYGNPK